MLWPSVDGSKSKIIDDVVCAYETEKVFPVMLGF